VLRHFEDKAYFMILDLKRVEDGGELALECDIHHGTDHLRDFAKLRRSGGLGCEEPRTRRAQASKASESPR